MTMKTTFLLVLVTLIGLSSSGKIFAEDVRHPCDFSTKGPAENWRQAELQDQWFHSAISHVAPASPLLYEPSSTRIFFISTAGIVYNYYWDADHDWEVNPLNVSQPLMDPLGGLTWLDTTGKIFAIGTNGKVHNFYFQNNAWQVGQLTYTQNINIDPRGGLLIDPSIEKVFGIGVNGKVYNFYFQNNAWHFTELIPAQPNLIDARGGLALDNHIGKVFAIGTNGKVYNFYFQNNAWQVGQLTATQYMNMDPRGRLLVDSLGKVYGIGVDGRVYNFYFQNNAWHFAGLIPAQTNTMDARGSLAIDSTIGKIFAVGTNGKVYNFYFQNNAWQFGQLTAAQYVNIDATGGLQVDSLGKVFGIGTDKKIYNFYFSGNWHFASLYPQQDIPARASNKLAVTDNMVFYTSILGKFGMMYYTDDRIFYPDWQLVVDEEFGNNTTLATLANNWNFDLWGRHNNNILQGMEYATGPGNLSVGNGVLDITAKYGPFWGKYIEYQLPDVRKEDGQLNYRQWNYTSGAMVHKQTFKYGLFEIFTKMPYAPGVWPSFWLSGTQSWPPEIDVMEQIGGKPNWSSSNVHWSTPDGNEFCAMEYTSPNATEFSGGYHKFSMAWLSDKIIYYLDGKEIRRVTDFVPDQPMYLITGMGVSRLDPPQFLFNLPPPVGFPAHMLIDYIRVYRPRFQRIGH